MTNKLMIAATAAMVLTVGAQADIFSKKENNAQLGYNYIQVNTGSSQNITASGVALHLNTKRPVEAAPKWSMLTTVDFGYSSTSDLNGYAGTTNSGSSVLFDLGLGIGVGYEPINNLTISVLGSGAMIAQGDFYWYGLEGGANITYEISGWTINARYLAGSMKLEAATSATDTVSTTRAFVGVGYKF